ncbi:unnamed protein product [Auanema sp. JU1783]|nr:unnamed protein product [Auanema sp. JU1783]
MSQAVTETHQTGPIPNGCGETDELTIEPLDTDKHDDSSSKASPDGDLMQLSPTSARRRSTRASALKAQEKIKFDGVLPVPENVPSESGLSDTAEDEEDGASASKKRKLITGTDMDQSSHTFYIKEDNTGDVCEVSEESDISSLHSGEVAALKAGYDKACEETDMQNEQTQERNIIVKRCEAELRLEEARLLLLRKINSSQTVAQQKANEAKRMTPNIALNNPGGAYKPAVALPKNGASAQRTNTPQRPNTAGGLTQQQQAELIKLSSTNPQMLQQLLQMAKNGKSPQQLQSFVAALVAQQQQQHQQLKDQQIKDQQAKEALMKEQQQQNAQLNAAKNFAALTPQQRAANARQAFRLQADKQLTQNLNTPKAHPVDFNFVPNPNQPDFCHLVALDLIVQRLLKDKMSTVNVSEKPYECEECHTDFSPSWKAMGSPDDLHLYCERCVHATQKKKIQKDHTAYLRKAFNKVQIQEKEFEKQIAEGKLDAVMAAAAQAVTAPSTPSLSTKQNGTSSTPNTVKPSTPSTTSSARTPSTPSSASASTKNKNSGMSFGNMSQMQMAMLLRNPMMASLMNGVPANSASLNTAVTNMMMYSPVMQMFLAAQQQQQQQQQQQSRGNQQAAQPNMAAMLLNAAMSAQAQGGITNFANMNSAAMLANPQLMRQFQEQFLNEHDNLLI